MEVFITVLKIVVALSLINVWLVQYKKPTQWRGGNATNIFQEFEVYGLSETFCYTVGVLKVGLALALLASIWFPSLELIASLGLALLLTGSIFMHLKVKDDLKKSFPAALFLVICLVIAFF
jgi:preprotein translocase subunit SecG